MSDSFDHSVLAAVLKHGQFYLPRSLLCGVYIGSERSVPGNGKNLNMLGWDLIYLHECPKMTSPS